MPHFISSAFVGSASFEVEATVASLELIKDVESNLWLVFTTSVEGRRWFLIRDLCTLMGYMGNVGSNGPSHRLSKLKVINVLVI